MNRNIQSIHLLTLSVLLATILVSCAHGGTSTLNPVDPGLTADTRQASYEPNRYLWGYWQIRLDPSDGTFEAIPQHVAADHWNVLKWLEGGPCTNCVKVTGAQDVGTAYPKFDIEITHPFSSPNLTGFDVRGIAMFDGGQFFPKFKLNTPESTIGDWELLNSDGLTPMYTWFTAGSGPGGAQGYIPGKFSTDEIPDSTLHGYISFVTNDAANTRNAFYAGDVITETYNLYAPSTKPLVLGYAVDACWAPPTTKPVTDPMVDFPPEANCPEPWKIVAYTSNKHMTNIGGKTYLTVNVYDYDGKDSYEKPQIECPGLWDGIYGLTYLTAGPGYAVFSGWIENENKAPAGFYSMLISVKANEDATAPDWLNLSAYKTVQLRVWPEEGHVDTWGSLFSESGWDVASDADGNYYVAGAFTGNTFTVVDFDPGPLNNLHPTNGLYDCFLSKFDYNGEWQWTNTWGGTSDDGASNVAADADHIYVTGVYSDTVDFDPGTGDASHTSNGFQDCFLVAFNQDGTYAWSSTWGSVDNNDSATAVVLDQDNVYAGGYFFGTTDFDPGTGVENHVAGIWTSGGFMCRYNTSGEYQLARTWGAATALDAVTVTGIAKSSGVAYVSGYYTGTVDFDPGTGTDSHTSIGGYDCFVSAITGGGDFQWSRAWGGAGGDIAQDIFCTSNSYVYVVGQFEGSVDFDPGTGTMLMGSIGLTDAFLSRFTSTGDFNWTETWGGTGFERAMNVHAGNSFSDILYVVGDFQDSVDFNPGPGVEYHGSTGSRDAFVSQFDFDGELSWVQTIGGPDGDDYAFAVTSDQLGNAYVTGSFFGTVDFDPVGNTGERESNGEFDTYIDKILYDGTWY